MPRPVAAFWSAPPVRDPVYLERRLPRQHVLPMAHRLVLRSPVMWLPRVWLTRPFRWRSPGSTARLLLKLAQAERSSFHDMMEAANVTKDVTRRATYLRHAIDEQRHAAMFRLRALELVPALAADLDAFRVDFEHLYSTLGETRFLAVVHRGERRGRAQLALYRDELLRLEVGERGDPKTRALFDAILKDEAHHEAYTAALTPPSQRRWATWWEGWRAWRRLGRGPTSFVFTVCMWFVFGLCTPVSWVARRRRAVGWRTP